MHHIPSLPHPFLKLRITIFAIYPKSSTEKGGIPVKPYQKECYPYTSYKKHWQKFAKGI
jgi:hypothetical protein